jgi:hypothetical protein
LTNNKNYDTIKTTKEKKEIFSMATDNAKITKRDNYNALYDLVSNAGLDQETEDRLHAFIDHELELMAQRAEKSKKYQQEHKESDDAMTDMICDVLAGSDAALTVPDIVAKIVDSTPQKVVYRLGKLFKDGKISKDVQNVKVDGSPARKVTFYTMA